MSGASGAAAGVAGCWRWRSTTSAARWRRSACSPADGEGEASRISVGGPRGLEVMAPLDARVARELSELMDRNAAARLVTLEDVGGALAGHLRRHGVQSAMIAPLPGTRRMVGTVMLADRSGLGGSFGPSEITLFDTLAHQTGAALGQDRMTTKVDELKELQVELERQAFHDPLTGLANRLLFMNRVDFVLKRRTGNAAVIYVDLDNFKPINDTLRPRGRRRGAEGGGRAPAASLRPPTPRRGSAATSSRCCWSTSPRSTSPSSPTGSSATSRSRSSSTAASWRWARASAWPPPPRTLDADALVRNADVAMYVAKHGGKGRLSVFERPEPVAA